MSVEQNVTVPEREMSAMSVEQNVTVSEGGDKSMLFDDDGREKRSGTWVTASAHIITAVIGSGVLSLAWANAQLGWLVGPAALVVFSIITYAMSTMLADCYRSPDPVTGKRNYTYAEAVRSYLGKGHVLFCSIAQYANLIGVTIGYTITGAISMVTVVKSNCFHKHGQEANCNVPYYPYVIIFSAIQLFLSQIPNFHNLSWLSILAAVMSFGYSLIGIGLAIAKAVEGPRGRTTLTGVTVGIDVTSTEKVWRIFQAIGNIAFAYAFSTVLIEIQDTLKSSPPENKAMKRATLTGVSVTTLFYVLCGCIGYLAFGNDAPGNFLTGFTSDKLFWLIDIANLAIIIHLIGAFQVFCQPIFDLVEKKCAKTWPENKLLVSEYGVKLPFCGQYNVNVFRLVWRTTYVIFTAIISMLFPFFNDFVGLIGAASFWPLTVYLPIEMFIAQRKMTKSSPTWILLKALSFVCLLVSLVAAAASIRGLIKNVMSFKPFQVET